MNSAVLLTGNDGVDLEHRRRHHDAGDRHHARQVIEIQMRIERGVDRVRRGDEEERVAVGIGVDRRLGGDVAAGAVAVLDDELLAERFRQRLGDQPRADIGRAAGGITDEDQHRARRIALRAREPRHGGQRHGAAGETQHGPAGNFHRGPPLSFLGLLAWRLHQSPARAYPPAIGRGTAPLRAGGGGPRRSSGNDNEAQSQKPLHHATRGPPPPQRVPAARRGCPARGRMHFTSPAASRRTASRAGTCGRAGPARVFRSRAIVRWRGRW